jgi:RNA polymerase-binding transcription factor DksA
MVNVEKYRLQLEARLKELRERLIHIEEELDETPDPDFAERAIQHEDDEVLEALGNDGLMESRRINAALKRIANDAFGFCLKCDEPILEERLDVLPYATLCRNCARQVEKSS